MGSDIGLTPHQKISKYMPQLKRCPCGGRMTFVMEEAPDAVWYTVACENFDCSRSDGCYDIESKDIAEVVEEWNSGRAL